ncbi:MAG: DUF4178 domain-containing protein [Myxococcales bacterium]|nr:DUF4178 domain-containing protein [Myxococcales bacterium]
MKTACPQCGAEIEFRFDDSFVRVCGSCRSAVTRTDRGVESLGRIADLMPLDSPLALFAEGQYGNQSFLLIGKAQVRHAAGGIWQEWYAKFSSGVWGWLAEAQGRFYMTFEVPGTQVPPHYQLAPGAQVVLPTHGGPRTFTVAEVGVATYTGADGELPYRLTPNAMFRYADLTDGQGAFATIDYGPPAAPGPAARPADAPSVYVGGQIRLADLHLMGGEVVPAAGPRISSQRLACPNCGGSLELHAPDAALRVVCPFCNTMLDVGGGGALSILATLRDKATPGIPLGRKVTFSEGELTIIGYLLRGAKVDDTWYPFEEYLLHSPALGFRWLVCSDGHWSYVQPVSPGACQADAQGAKYKGRTFKRYQDGPLRVEMVLGEFYWKVQVGETTQGEDFTSPPAMLSRETGHGEINWSLSTYLSHAEVRKAVGDVKLPPAEGVAPNQAWPHTGIGKWYWLLLAALVISGIVLAGSTTAHKVASFQLDVPAGKPPPPPDAPAGADPGHVLFTEPFEIKGGENIEITLAAPLNNNWMYVVADLVDEDKGTFLTFDTNLEYYSGYEGGESWSEGSMMKVQTLGPMPAGNYVLRLEAQTGTPAASPYDTVKVPGLEDIRPPTPAIPLSASIRQNVFQGGLWALALLLLLLLGLFLFLSKRRFENRRQENSSVGNTDSGDDHDYDHDHDFGSGGSSGDD